MRRLLDSPWFYFALAGLVALVGIASMFEVHVPSRPRGDASDIEALAERDDVNVVFLLVDTLRADRLSGYGYDRPTSPVMDDLAKYGVRFADVESQSSWTKASMGSLMTGFYPVRTGVTRYDQVVSDAAMLPAEVFKQAGFRTGGVWRNGWIAANFGFGQGYDAYFHPAPKPRPEEVRKARPGQHIGGTDEDLTDAAVEYVRAHGHERFFLYVHYMDVHQYAYDQAAADLGFGTSHSDAYDAAIHWVDRNIGRLMLELDDRDLFKRTMVVIASDHGEAFFEHGAEGHARNLYREVTQVPLIIAFPFVLKPGITVLTSVRNVDIWPTVYDLLGLPPVLGTDGRSLKPAILAAARGEQDGPPPPVVSYLDRNWGQVRLDPNPLVAVREDDRRVIFWANDPDGAEAYDHSEDPGEQHDLAKSGAAPAWLDELREIGKEQLAAPPAWGDAPKVQLDEMYREQLRALGYVIK